MSFTNIEPVSISLQYLIALSLLFVNTAPPRPYADEFLERVSYFYDLWVWTASDKEYANYILALLDTHDKYIKRIIAKDMCIKCGNIYIKDIRIFNNLDLRKTVILDNLLVSFATTLSNGILISPFTCNENDCELNLLVGFLEGLASVDDFREVLKKTFDYGKYVY